ncbi:MAG: hypothetical protein PVG65_05315 [Candidatus Thorarchaeota archaeon]|jgi:hypothetical protein
MNFFTKIGDLFFNQQLKSLKRKATRLERYIEFQKSKLKRINDEIETIKIILKKEK